MKKPINEDTLAEALALIARYDALLSSEPGDFVRFAIEDDPDAGVWFCRANGHPVMWMPTEVYIDLKKKEELEKKETNQ